MFVPGKFSQLILMVESKVGAYPNKLRPQQVQQYWLLG